MKVFKNTQLDIEEVSQTLTIVTVRNIIQGTELMIQLCTKRTITFQCGKAFSCGIP